MKKIKQQNLKEHLFFIRLFLLFIIPLILSMPLLSPRKYGINFPQNTSTTSLATVAKEEIKINGSQTLFIKSTSIFSQIVGIEILPYPISICLNNRNKILLDGTEKQSNELPDGKEGAAISVKVDNTNSQNSVELYAPKDKQVCKILNLEIGDTAIMRSPQIRGVFPMGQAEAVSENGSLVIRLPIYSNAVIDVEYTDIVVKTVFGWVILRNFLVYLFGIAALISLTQTLVRFLKWKWD